MTLRLLVVALLLPTLGCGADEETLTVLAAASLARPFTTLAETFEETHPGVDVRLAFASSATLAQQTLDGAPADVLATADAVTMERAAPALAGAPRTFATNRLALVVPADNPAAIEEVGDLGRPGVQLVACVESAPCGALAADVLDDVGATPASLEVDVSAVLSKVVSGEADAGLVYRSDVIAGGDAVAGVPLPDAPTTGYRIAAVGHAEQPELAEEFVSLTLSHEGRRVLADAGFGAP